MAKLTENNITKKNIKEYLDKYSDFSFEIKVLNKINSLGFSCNHSGTYEDPITKKTREFDIRANKVEKLSTDVIFTICLAVECKNISNEYPLLFHCLSRTEDEAYQDLVWSEYYRPSSVSSLPLSNLYTEYAKKITLSKEDSVYKMGELVGKSCDQIGRKKNNEIFASDSSVFDKISQSINSSFDIFHWSHYECTTNNNMKYISIIIPILVVPKNTIWYVLYDDLGSQIKGPENIERIPYFVNKHWKIGEGKNESPNYYYISHIEVVELDSLEYLLDLHTEKDRFSYDNLEKYYFNMLGSDVEI